MQGQTRLGEIECPNCAGVRVRAISTRVDASTGRPYLPRGVAWLIAFVLTVFAGGLIGAAVAGELHSGPVGAVPASIPAVAFLALAALFVARGSRDAFRREVDRCEECGLVWTPPEVPVDHGGGTVSRLPRGRHGASRAR